jgi:type III pantothenate kinase
VPADTLLIDIGNSRLKWCLLHDAQPGAVHAIDLTSTSMAAQLQHAWPTLQPARLLVCSVAQASIDRELSRWSQQHWGIAPRFFTSETPYPGMHCGYANPSQLGNDRWLAAIAAYQRCRQAVAVIDAGSAITIDLVDAQGQHQGGWILPGLVALRNALRNSTAIPPFSATIGDMTPGTTTDHCIANGILLACVGALEKAGSAWRDHHWILSGGDARTLSPHLNLPHETVDNLLMEGLAHLACMDDPTP